MEFDYCVFGIVLIILGWARSFAIFFTNVRYNLTASDVSVDVIKEANQT